MRVQQLNMNVTKQKKNTFSKQSFGNTTKYTLLPLLAVH